MKRILFAVMVCIFVLSAHSVFSLSLLAGNGTKADPFIISTPIDLMLYGATMYDDDTGNCPDIGESDGHNHFTSYGVLANDIDLSGIPDWQPISGGCWYGRDLANFDGQGHTISGLTSTTGGIFGAMMGTVKNLNVDVVSAPWAIATGGVLYGYAGTYYNIHVTGNATTSGVIRHCAEDFMDYITVNLTGNVPAFTLGLYYCSVTKLANYGPGPGVGEAPFYYSDHCAITDSFSLGRSLLWSPYQCSIIHSYTAGRGWLAASWSIDFPSLNNSFYNNETANESASYTWGEGQSTTWLQNQANFEGRGWDFVYTWMMGPSGYPELIPPNWRADVNIPVVDYVMATFDNDTYNAYFSCGIHDNEGNVSIYFQREHGERD